MGCLIRLALQTQSPIDFRRILEAKRVNSENSKRSDLGRPFRLTPASYSPRGLLVRQLRHCALPTCAYPGKTVSERKSSALRRRPLVSSLRADSLKSGSYRRLCSVRRRPEFSRVLGVWRAVQHDGRSPSLGGIGVRILALKAIARVSLDRPYFELELHSSKTTLGLIEVIATAKAQRWDPAEVMRVLLEEEVKGRDDATRRRRRRPAFPPARPSSPGSASLIDSASNPERVEDPWSGSTAGSVCRSPARPARARAISSRRSGTAIDQGMRVSVLLAGAAGRHRRPAPRSTLHQRGDQADLPGGYDRGRRCRHASCRPGGG